MNLKYQKNNIMKEQVAAYSMSLSQMNVGTDVGMYMCLSACWCWLDCSVDLFAM